MGDVVFTTTVAEDLCAHRAGIVFSDSLTCYRFSQVLIESFDSNETH